MWGCARRRIILYRTGEVTKSVWTDLVCLSRSGGVTDRVTEVQTEADWCTGKHCGRQPESEDDERDKWFVRKQVSSPEQFVPPVRTRPEPPDYLGRIRRTGGARREPSLLPGGWSGRLSPNRISWSDQPQKDDPGHQNCRLFRREVSRDQRCTGDESPTIVLFAAIAAYHCGHRSGGEKHHQCVRLSTSPVQLDVRGVGTVTVPSRATDPTRMLRRRDRQWRSKMGTTVVGWRRCRSVQYNGT